MRKFLELWSLFHIIWFSKEKHEEKKLCLLLLNL